MSDVIKEETTNHPEGATLSLSKCQVARKRGGMLLYSELSARMNDAAVRMRVSDVSTHNLRRYLDLCVVQINRERLKVTTKPGMGCQHPRDFREFVTEMAFKDMFVFKALEAEPEKPVKSGKVRKRAKKDVPEEMPF